MIFSLIDVEMISAILADNSGLQRGCSHTALLCPDTEVDHLFTELGTEMIILSVPLENNLMGMVAH